MKPSQTDRIIAGTGRLFEPEPSRSSRDAEAA